VTLGRMPVFWVFVFYHFFIYIAGPGSKSSSDPLVPTSSIAQLNATERLKRTMSVKLNLGADTVVQDWRRR